MLEGSADYYYYDEKGNVVARACKAGNYVTALSDGTKKEVRIGEIGNITVFGTPQYPYGLTGVTFFPYAEAVISE